MKKNKILPSHKPDELLACFDSKGGQIEPKFRREVHRSPLSVWHGVANIWLLNNYGKILCSKRSSCVEGNPGKWQTYFGGHVEAGCGFLETIKREIKEEIGLDALEGKIILVGSGKREDAMHIYKNYAILFEGDLFELNFIDGEVSEAKWFSFNEYQKQKNHNPDKWCNGMNINQYGKATEL